jgi:hypothetical protein
MVGFYDHGNEPSVFIEGILFFDKLSDYLLS